MYDPTDHEDLTPQPHHRFIVALLVTFGNSVLLTLALWQLAGACTQSGDLANSFAFIAVGLLPFSVTVQACYGTPMADRMRTGRLFVVSGLFAMAVLIGPGPTFLGISCTSGPTIAQTAVGMMTIAWLAWFGLRFADPDLQRD